MLFNIHPRDNLIQFYPKWHKYEITIDPQSKYTSVTTWNHGHFPKFDADKVIQNIFNGKKWGPDHTYWGMTAEQIKQQWKTKGDEASSAGTQLHDRIETFLNKGCGEKTHQEIYEMAAAAEAADAAKEEEEEEVKEWNYFLQFVCDHPTLKPYRTEWKIFDEDLKLAGSIDIVYENPDGTLAIYDWKRSKDISKINDWHERATNPLIEHLHHSNFWHYALQLNTYRAILERKYGKKVTHLCLVRLHPEADTYELLEVPLLDKEIQDLFEERQQQIRRSK